jgi:chaperonin cofactor prefoldin
MEVVESTWNMEVNASSSATRIVSKFKNLRKTLKRWGLGLSRLKAQIKTCNEILLILDKLEENRPLNTPGRQF